MSSDYKISTTGETDQYLRDHSFATYLAYVRQSFSNANSRRSSFQSLPPSSISSSTKDLQRELEVFDAEKYFSGILDNHHQQPNSGSSKSYTRRRTRASTTSEDTTKSCTGILGVKFVSSSSCVGKKRSFFSVFRTFRCYRTPKTAVVGEDEEEEEDDGGGVGRCRIDAKMPALDFRRSLEVARRVERCRTLDRKGSSELFEISSVHEMK